MSNTPLSHTYVRHASSRADILPCSLFTLSVSQPVNQTGRLTYSTHIKRRHSVCQASQFKDTPVTHIRPVSNSVEQTNQMHVVSQSVRQADQSKDHSCPARKQAANRGYTFQSVNVHTSHSHPVSQSGGGRDAHPLVLQRSWSMDSRAE